MGRRALMLVTAGAVLAIAVLAAGIGGAFGGSTQADARASAVDTEIAKLFSKLHAFTTVGGQPGQIRNLDDLQRAIEIEARQIERGGAGMAPTQPEDIERLNSKLALFQALGGNPTTLAQVRDQLRQAIEKELAELLKHEGG